MKKILIVLISVITLTSCTQKIGFVNTEKLIQDYKGTKIAEAILKEKSTLMQNELTKIETVFQEKVKKMSKIALNRKMNELNQENNYIQQQKQQAQYSLQGESQKSLEKISKEVNDFVKKYAKDNGYKFVLGTVDVNGSVMYGDEKSDITYAILKALNNAYIEPTEVKEVLSKKVDNTEETKSEDKKSEETK
ncbi:MAG: OmpH family outer membrane protein [Flavobacteriaceae bacterium]|nr:OmpH family outer membrane protein [Flavobacteriaceae bacterium]